MKNATMRMSSIPVQVKGGNVRYSISISFQASKVRSQNGRPTTAASRFRVSRPRIFLLASGFRLPASEYSVRYIRKHARLPHVVYSHEVSAIHDRGDYRCGCPPTSRFRGVPGDRADK